MKSYRRNSNLLFSIAIVFILGLVAALTWSNYQYARQNPGGNDFLVHWMGTRNFLLYGTSPYSDQTAIAIQTMAYGRPAIIGKEHELRVAYPLYSIVLFTPFALIPDFTLARAIWMTVLEGALVLVSFISIRLADWKPNILILALFMLFSVFWYHGLRPLINGNAVILIALFIVGAFYAIKNGNDELAGVLLAFSSVKPQLAVVVMAFVFIWSLRQGRLKIIVWMLTTLLLLVLSAVLLIPDWMLQNVREVMRYPGYNPPGTLATALLAMLPGLGKRLPLIIAGLLGIIMLGEWFLVKPNRDFKTFLWTASLSLVISQWIGIQTDPGNFIILMPALVLSLALLESRWRWGKVFTYLVMLFLFLGLWWLFIQTAIPGDQLQQGPIMFLPLPAVLLALLYWVRWWVFRPPSVWFDDVQAYNLSRR